MKIIFSDIISESVEWTKQVLFKPFNFKKWIILGFVAIMAGYMGGGGNYRSANRNPVKPSNVEAATTKPTAVVSESSLVPATSAPTVDRAGSKPVRQYKEVRPYKGLGLLVLVAVIFSFALIFLFSWLGSRFSFVFLEDVAGDDASIRRPFKDHRQIGNSLFKFNLIFGFLMISVCIMVVILGLVHLKQAGIALGPDFNGLKQALFVGLPYLLIFILFLIIGGIIAFIAHDFVTVIMLKDKLNFMAAWKKTWVLIKANSGSFIKCLFVRLGLGICCAIIGMIVYLLGFLVIFIPGIIAGLILFLIYKSIPLWLQLPFFVFLGVVLSPVVVFILYCLLLLELPFAVFFRTFSIKFLGRLDQNYDLFYKVLQPA